MGLRKHSTAFRVFYAQSRAGCDYFIIIASGQNALYAKDAACQIFIKPGPYRKKNVQSYKHPSTFDDKTSPARNNFVIIIVTKMRKAALLSIKFCPAHFVGYYNEKNQHLNVRAIKPSLRSCFIARERSNVGSSRLYEYSSFHVVCCSIS